MRKPLFLTLVLLTLLLIAAGVVLALQQQQAPADVAASLSADTAGVSRITVAELERELQAPNPPLVWDIRTTTDFATGHIPSSRVMTFDGIPDAAAGLDKQQSIVTLCA